MLGDLDWSRWNLNDFPCPLHPSATQTGATLWTDPQGMLGPFGWGHPHPGETVGSPVARCLSWCSAG